MKKEPTKTTSAGAAKSTAEPDAQAAKIAELTNDLQRTRADFENYRKQMDAQNPNAFKNTIAQCGQQIAMYMNYSERLQLLNFLVQIAKADGSVVTEEINALKEVAVSMGLSVSDVDSALSLGGTTLEEAYKVLEISPDATDEEVRKAYRKLALEHHPDKVETLGEDIKKAAEQKFKQINEAKEIVYKARGMK